MLSQHEWIQNPFAVTVSEKIRHLSIKSQESPMELACDSSLKMKFEALPLPDFWTYIQKEYVELSQPAINILLLSGTAYLFEKTFFSTDSN
jgi:hypothetical protein